MEFNHINAVSSLYLLSPVYEDIILQSERKEILSLRDEWNEKYRSLSFSAFIMHKRIQAYRNIHAIGRIFPRFNWSRGSPHHKDVKLLRYGFVTYKNRKLIYLNNEYSLYGIHHTGESTLPID